MKDKGGRPRYEVDYKKLDTMCAIQCTGEECAAILGVDYDTLNRALKRDGNTGFAEYYRIKGSKGKMSLRRRQYECAMAGNSTMLVWLGKQWLKQSDKNQDDDPNRAAPDLNITFAVADAKQEVVVTKGE